MSNRVRALIVAPLLAAGVAGGVGEAAAADPPFKACYDLPCFGNDKTEFGIVWYNRTAGLSGSVFNSGAPDVTQAVFQAFAGGTLVDSEPRTDTNADSAPRGFGFTIGDPNLVGGIDRIRVTVCVYAPTKTCGPQFNFLRP